MKLKRISTVAVACTLLAAIPAATQAQDVYANIFRKSGDAVSLPVAASQKFYFTTESPNDYVRGTYKGAYVTFTEENHYKCEAISTEMPQGATGGACFDGKYYHFTTGGYAVYDIATGENVKATVTLASAPDVSFNSVDFSNTTSYTGANGAALTTTVPLAYATGLAPGGTSQTVSVIDIENDALVATYTFDNQSAGSVMAWDFAGGRFWLIGYAETEGNAPYTVQEYRFSSADSRGYEEVGEPVRLQETNMTGKLGDCKYLNGHIYIIEGNRIHDYHIAKNSINTSLDLTTITQPTALAIVQQERRFVTTNAEGWTNVFVAPFAYKKNENQQQVVNITKTDGTTFSSNVDCLEDLYYSTAPATTAEGVLTYGKNPIYFGETYSFRHKRLSTAPDMSDAATSQTINGTTYELSSNGIITYGNYSIPTGLTGTSTFKVDADNRKFVIATSGGTCYDLIFDDTFNFSDETPGEGNVDSLALVNAYWNWQTITGEARYGKAAFSSLFNSAQTISVIQYPESSFSTSIVSKMGSEANGTDKLAAAAGAKWAINGSYFNMTTYVPETALWLDGEMVANTTDEHVTRCTGIVAFKDGKIDFDRYNAKTTSDAQLAEWQNRYDAFLASGHLLRLDGVEQSPFAAVTQAFDGVNPRSMIGVTADRTVYMVVVDGRKSGTADGLTIPQMAALAKYLGLVDAINLDGGGSSTLWVQGKGVINSPSGGSVRRVPNIIIAK